jgi:hypothetical protein
MNESERAQAEAAGLRLQTALNLGQGRGVDTIRIPNPELAEASRLGQILLDHWAAADVARRNPTTETDPEGND